MTRIWLVIAVAVLLCTPADVMAKHHHRHHEKDKRPVWTVYDRLPDEWQPEVLETIADFNANMPPKGPLLKYVKLTSTICGKTNTSISICGGDGNDPDIGDYWGLAIWGGSDKMTILVNVQDENRPDEPYERETVLCHEMMHLVTHVNDNHNALPNESCVWGSLTDLGSWDIQKLWDVWGNGKGR
jgi:hypothetical protein